MSPYSPAGRQSAARLIACSPASMRGPYDNPPGRVAHPGGARASRAQRLDRGRRRGGHHAAGGPVVRRTASRVAAARRGARAARPTRARARGCSPDRVRAARRGRGRYAAARQRRSRGGAFDPSHLGHERPPEAGRAELREPRRQCSRRGGLSGARPRRPLALPPAAVPRRRPRGAGALGHLRHHRAGPRRLRRGRRAGEPRVRRGQPGVVRAHDARPAARRGPAECPRAAGGAARRRPDPARAGRVGGRTGPAGGARVRHDRELLPRRGGDSRPTSARRRAEHRRGRRDPRPRADGGPGIHGGRRLAAHRRPRPARRRRAAARGRPDQGADRDRRRERGPGRGGGGAALAPGGGRRGRARATRPGMGGSRDRVRRAARAGRRGRADRALPRAARPVQAAQAGGARRRAAAQPRRKAASRRDRPLESPPVIYDRDADLGVLEGRTVAILGYGSQGHAHALNLKDSGASVVVGLREGSSSAEKARGEGLRVEPVADAASHGDVVMVLLPDEKQAEVWESEISDGIAPGNLVMFAHGFSIHFGQIDPGRGVDVGMVAPKGPGHLVRRQFVEGNGVPGLVAVHQDATGDARDLVLAYARGIGCTRAGVIETSFKDETETDLFGEQAVLCGGVTELVRAGYETLVEAGYDPRLAYFECLHELKLIVDLMYEKGIQGMRHSISNTAEYGDMTRGKRIIGPETREAMRQILADIQSGEFARERIAENRAGAENFQHMREEAEGHQVEQVGSELRKMMPWIEGDGT